MATEKYVNIGGVWKSVSEEYANIGGSWKTAITNYANIGGAWKDVPLGDRRIFSSESVNDELYRIDGSPAEDWHYDLADATVVAVNDLGESYWCAGRWMRKLNADGTLQTSFMNPWNNLLLSIAVENRSGSYYIYFADAVGHVFCFLDNMDGSYNQQWQTDIDPSYTPPINGLAVDTASGQIYAAVGAGTNVVSRGFWRASVSTGTFVQRYATPTADGICIAADTNSPVSVYFGTSDYNYRKLSLDGYVYWTKLLTGRVTSIEIAHNGYGYLSCESEKKVYKFTASTGVAIWNYTPSTSAYAYDIAVDSSGNVYAVYRYLGGSSGNYIYKISKDGAYVWKWQSYVNVKFYGIAVTPGLEAAGW